MGGAGGHAGLRGVALCWGCHGRGVVRAVPALVSGVDEDECICIHPGGAAAPAAR